MDLGLSGKRALVTGASKGIGLAITRALLAQGARVVAGARHTGDEVAELVEDGQVQAINGTCRPPGVPASSFQRH